MLKKYGLVDVAKNYWLAEVLIFMETQNAELTKYMETFRKNIQIYLENTTFHLLVRFVMTLGGRNLRSSINTIRHICKGNYKQEDVKGEISKKVVVILFMNIPMSVGFLYVDKHHYTLISRDRLNFLTKRIWSSNQILQK